MEEQKRTKKEGNVVTVDPVAAGQQTENYRTFMNNEGINEIAFYISAEDILSALELPITSLPENHNVSGVRVYMALDELPNGERRSHLYVVGTDNSKNDITHDANNNSLIYDMTWPCPNLCSDANILNGFGTEKNK